MSLRFDKTNDGNSGDWLRADHATAMAPTFPFSVSLWVYFEANVTGTETIWFYGDKGAADKHLVLEARLVSSVTKLRARMKNASGDGPTSTDTVAVSNNVWHLVTVVATKDGTQVTLTVYLDTEIAKTGNSDVGTTNEGDYDRFALGRWAGTGIEPLNPGSFLAEQAAIWDSELSGTNHGTMYADDLNGEDVRRPPTHLSTDPDIGYWVIAGHHRNGLRTSVDLSQRRADEGDLFNESGGSQPNMELSAETNPGPLWSVKTPALLYDDGTASGLPVRVPKARPSRYNPQFFFFQKPELWGTWGQGNNPGTHPIYDDPNMIVMARLKIDEANFVDYRPPEFDSLDYHPQSYLTQVAKRVADWFEYQGFTNETGSEGGGQYEGAVFLQNLGWQDSATGLFGRDVQDTSTGSAGKGFYIPLEQHPKDELSAIFAAHEFPVWFRAKGEALVKEYADEFWPLLKAELDRRNLAYPKRLHWDNESSPSAGNVLSGGGNPAKPQGNFPYQLSDSRAGTEDIIGTQTLDDIWDATGSNAWNTYDPTKTAYDPTDVNLDWRLWYLGWQRMIRQDALSAAIMTPAANEFAEMKWSNYNDFVADNTDYPHYFYHPKDAVVTPQPSIPADYSSPVLYPNTNTTRIINAGFGVTKQSAQWAIWDAGIEACVNASSPLPLAPWVTSVGYTATPNPNGATPYTLTSADLRWLLRRCWQRGADEFSVWIGGGTTDAQLKATYDEFRFLSNTVKCMMNTNGSRTCRMGRTYRTCR